MGAGGLLRDHGGHWVAGFASHKPGCNPLLAEAEALHKGLMLAWRKGFRVVHCEVDSQELINKLQDHTVRRFMPILEHITNCLQKEWAVHLSKIHRDANAPADWLAKFGARNPCMDMREFVNPPPEIATLMLRDSIRVP